MRSSTVALACLVVLSSVALSAQATCVDYTEYLRETARITASLDPIAVDAQGGLAISTHLDGFAWLYDVSDPMAPFILGSVGLPGVATQVEIVDDLALFALESDGVAIYDVSDAESPAFLSLADTPGSAHAVAVVGERAYIADDTRGLRILDISNPASPTLLGQLDTPGVSVAVSVDGNIAYVANQGQGLQVFDVTNPAMPQIVTTLPLGGLPTDVAVRAGHAYVASSFGGLHVVDISAPGAPELIRTIDSIRPDSIRISGDTVVVTSLSAVVTLDIANPEDVVVVGMAQTRGTNLDLATTGSHAVTVGTTGLGAELTVIDVSTPTSVAPFGLVELPGVANHVQVQGSHAFVAGGAAGLLVVDVMLPEAPVLVGQLDGMEYAYDVEVVGDIAYVSDRNVGLVVVDVSSPEAPTWLATVPTAFGVDNFEVRGDFAYVMDPIGARLVIIDVSVPASPVVRSELFLPGQAADIALSGSYAFIADGFWGLDVVSITNPDAPQFITNLHSGEYYSIDIYGIVALCATFPVGMTAIDLSNPIAPVPLGTSLQTAGGNTLALGSSLYVADGGVRLFDLEVTPVPEHQGSAGRPRGMGIATDGDYLYLTTGLEQTLEVFPTHCPTDPAEVAGPTAPVSELVASPNPSRGATTIRWALPPNSGPGSLTIVNAAGQVIAKSPAFERGAALVDWTWNHEDDRGALVPRGVYWVRAQSGNVVLGSRQLVVLE